MNLKRLGKRNPESSVRPRPVEIQLSSSYNRRITMNNRHLVKGTKVFAKPKLCREGRLKEKYLLGKRFELIQLRLHRDSLRIRDIKLFYNDVYLDPGEMQNLSLLSEKLKTMTIHSDTATVQSTYG